MRVVATFNIKGGVGKTTAAVNIAHAAAQDGLRTLIWDLDPQGAATYCFRMRPEIEGGAKRLFARRRGLAEHVRESDFPGLDVVPADFSYRKLDLLLAGLDKSKRRVRGMLAPLEGQYDLVVLDCPPSISLASEAVLRASTALLAPVIPTTLSLRMLARLREHLARREKGPELWPFFSMVDRRKALHREICLEVGGGDPSFFATSVPYASVVEQMGLYRAPIAAFAKSSEGARAFAALWGELRLRLGL